MRRVLAGGIAALVLLLVIIQVGAFRESQSLREQLDASYSRDLVLVRLLSFHQDVETGQRGYMITGRPDFLLPYSRALPEIRSAFDTMERQRGPVPTEQINRLRQLSARKLEITAQVISIRNKTGVEAAVAVVSSGVGKRAMDAFRNQVADMRTAEARRQAELVRSYANSSFQSQLLTGLIQLFLLFLVVAALVAYRANLARLRAVSAQAKEVSDRQIAIFNAATDAMIVVDQNATVESVNPAAEKLFAVQGSELVGKTIQDLFEGGVLHIAGYNERRRSRREGDAIRNLAGRRGDGSLFEAEVAASPVKLGEGARTLLLVRDSTERNRVERMKNEFVSTVSHELRTPLTSIRGALALMDHAVGERLEDKPKQLLKIAKSNSERLSLLVDDILDIEKIGSGTLDLALERIDVREVVQRASEQNETYASDRGVRLVTTVADEPLIVKGDPGRLLQALTNLVSNAAKFSPPSGIVRLTAERDGRCARISVADHGVGIPVEFRSQIFNRFAQARGQSSQRTGTGLGLAITKAIIDLHKGNIDYETAIGEGTKFWIDLPLARRTRNDTDASANSTG